MTQFTITVTDQSHLDGITWARTHSPIGGLQKQPQDDQEYFEAYVINFFKAWAEQKIDADIREAVTAAKAGDATKLQAIATSIAAAVPAPQPAPLMP